MDDLRTRIAAVVAAHRDQCGNCSCGWESWEESWDMHLADAVIATLGIYEDEMGTGDTRRARFVTDWVVIPGE